MCNSVLMNQNFTQNSTSNKMSGLHCGNGQKAKQLPNSKIIRWSSHVFTNQEYVQKKSLSWLLPYYEKIPQKSWSRYKLHCVMDCRELNEHTDALTINADVYASKLNEWHHQELNVSLLDFNASYLQMHIHDTL